MTEILLDLTQQTEYGRSFATRGRAVSMVEGLHLSQGDSVRIRIGLESFCAPGFIQGLLGALGTGRRVLVESQTCPPGARSILDRTAAAFGMGLEFR